MVFDGKLDRGLVRAIREGSSALPADLTRLGRYLVMIEGLLAEKAVEIEDNWGDVCAASAEIVTLQQLEVAVAERAIELRAETLEMVLSKFEIWRAMGAGDEEHDPGMSLRNRLVLSMEADLRWIARHAAR